MPNPKRLNFKLFKETFKHVPRTAVNLVITNNHHHILLARRTIPPKIDHWHLPGSFLLKYETIHSCLKRIAHKEIGITINPTNCKLLGVFENIHADPRGHIIDIAYTYQLNKQKNFPPTKESKEIKFFDHVPDQIAFNHQQIIKRFPDLGT